jgi:hypothetical protein
VVLIRLARVLHALVAVVDNGTKVMPATRTRSGSGLKNGLKNGLTAVSARPAHGLRARKQQRRRVFWIACAWRGR